MSLIVWLLPTSWTCLSVSYPQTKPKLSDSNLQIEPNCLFRIHKSNLTEENEECGTAKGLGTSLL